MNEFGSETKTRVYKDEEVQHEGLIERGAGGQTFWTWKPRDFYGRPDLPAIKNGKKIVFLYPCNCGCWTQDSTTASIEMINKDSNPERFVLRDGDPRFVVRRDEADWYVIDRPQSTGAG